MAAVTTTIASFPTSANNGTDPDGQLFMDSNGDLFGATVHGGSEANPTDQIGTTYEITKVAGSFATTPTYLADIPTGLNTLAGPNGLVPNLSADANGDLFGLMFSGGANSLGTVVEFPAGGGAPNTALATFTVATGASHPGGRLLVDASGNLFGTTLSGPNGSGPSTVFEFQKTTGTLTVLASFGSDITPSGFGNLVEDAAGDLFGTTTSSVFEVQKTGSGYGAPTSLVPFPVGTQIGTLTIDANGDIFGTTISGGANDDGTVFEIEKTATGYVSAAATLASFTSADGQLSLNHPKTLIVDANGDLFGTTDPSSQNSGGVVYEIVRTANGYESTPTIVHDFSGGANGVGLGANLVADASGDLFGTTRIGGANNAGTAFEITNSGFSVAPELTAGASINYVAAGSPVALDPGLSLSDRESATLVGATVSIGAGFLAGDTLSVGSPQTGVISSYNPGTGVLTLSGSATLAAYQAALDSVTFASPSAANPNRTINWSVNDGTQASAPASSNVSVFANISGVDITLQNTGSGQVSVWEMSSTTIIGGGSVADPGPSWQAVGTGDFFGNGPSDILMQNTSSGQVSVWEMNSNTVLGGGPVADPGPSWHAIGTGDFNVDGTSDILMQNTSSGQVSVWEMSGNNIIGGGPVANPGPSWQAVGTGDFNHDGNSDILMQNTSSGQVSVWEMSGNNIIGGGPVADPGPSWKAIGTGDFYGNGLSDILMQNTTDGQVSVWEMSGNNIIGGGPVADPGPSWHAIGTGGASSSDILMQNSSNGQVSIWDVSSNNIIGGGPVANPGPSWHGIGLT